MGGWAGALFLRNFLQVETQHVFLSGGMVTLGHLYVVTLAFYVSSKSALSGLCVLTPGTGLGTQEVPNKYWPEEEGLCPVGGSAIVTGHKRPIGYPGTTVLTATEGRWVVEGIQWWPCCVLALSI